MSNRPTLFLLISVGVGDKKKFRLFLLLPMWVALDLLDVLDDYCRIAAVLLRNVSYRTIGNGRQTVPAVLRTTCGVLTGCMTELVYESGPLDILDIDVSHHEHQAVKLKVYTR